MTVPTSLSDLLAAGTEVTVRGETFKLRKAELDEQAAFSKHLKDSAKREAATLPPGTPPEIAGEVVRGQLRAVFDQIGELAYEPLSEMYVAAQQRPDGMAEFLFIVMKRDNPGITREKVRELIEGGLAQAFLEVVAMEESDPKVLGDLCVALGFPRNFLLSSATSSSDLPTHPSTGSPGKSGG